MPDALADERFADNPLVTGPPHIRFYAGRAVRGPGGEMVGTLCVIDRRPRHLDEVQRKQLDDLADTIERELKLRVEANRVRKASDTKSQFIAEMSHELRTPTNVLLGSLRLLQEADHAGGDSQALDLAINAAEHIARLLNDLVDLSQIENRRFELNQTQFELGSLIHMVTLFAERECRKKGLTFRSRIQAGLPTKVNGDESRISQILLNILSNSVRYTESGRVEFSVSGDTMDNDMVHLKFVIDDTGLGMSASQIERIFEPYFRGSKARSLVAEGSGLGLAVAYQIARMMQGDISATSDERSGSTFQFVVDLSLAKEGAVRQQLDTAHDAPPPPLDRARIMVVEDSHSTRSLAGLLLKDANDVELLPDGESALERARVKSFDIILMDISLPGMAGIECARRIRRLPNHRNTKIIAVTAHALEGDRRMLLDSGFDDYLPKPYRKAVLISKITQYLGEHLTHSAGRR